MSEPLAIPKSSNISISSDELTVSAAFTLSEVGEVPVYHEFLVSTTKGTFIPVAVVVGNLRQYIPDETLSRGADLIGYEALSTDYQDLHEMYYSLASQNKLLVETLMKHGIELPVSDRSTDTEPEPSSRDDV